MTQRSIRDRLHALPVLAATALLLIGAAACAGPAGPAGPAATAPSSSAAEPLLIAVTIANGGVTPNGQKFDLPLGQTVELAVTSDADDEIHAHTGGDGFELEVKAGQRATGKFTLDQPGSFEVESHRLDKIIAILNVR